VRTLAVRPDHHGNGLGGRLVARVVEDARALGLERVIALTREVAFFERSGFAVVERDALPRKVWADCIRCPRRHACDEVAVLLELAPRERETVVAGADADEAGGAPGRAR
jgi:amino-acid N-acetyltransferase